MKLLIAEDDTSLRNLLKLYLSRWGYDVIETQDGNEAWRALTCGDAPRLALLDWLMPGINGVDICRKVRAELKEPYTYIILLTGQHKEEDIIAGMESGADDYITKPFKSNELRVRLRAGRRILELQDELLAAQEILRARASRDSLTGLWNHAEIYRILVDELARAKREDTSVSVIMADLDNFKMINDTYGHLVGDSVLRLASERMLSLMRSYDYVGRYGGEEFLIVMQGCDWKDAEGLAERLRCSICSEPMDTPEGMIPVAISLGVSMSRPDNRLDANSLVKAADMALYRAKGNGRNRVEMDG
ncbi:MAG: diguanylate cyclase response regulator [Geobacter sp.]|nr:MAG: diguanylate cyclase response regulator [Geobacter sp.]